MIWKDEEAIKARKEVDPAFRARVEVDSAFKARVKGMLFDEIVIQVNELIDNSASAPENLSKLEWMTIKPPDHHTHDSDIYLTRMFLALGEGGIKRLESLLDPINGLLQHQIIIETIYLAGSKQLQSFTDLALNERPDIRQPVITDAMAALAKETFENLVLRMHTDRELLRSLISIVYYKGINNISIGRFVNQFPNVITDVFDIVTEASIAISRRMLKEFEELINRKEREEIYQQFLERNPVLLDPLAKRRIPKHRLGDDYITDFVIETLDGRYLLVEIEKPHSQMFNSKDDFSAEFSHAFGQVLDFQHWIESNHEYANKKLPGISSPPGLLVMDLRTRLTEKQLAKLSRMNIDMRGTVQILCYDDLLTNGQR